MKNVSNQGLHGALWMVEASAGTGKTYRLISEVLLAVLRGVELRKILVVTFSKKATAELSQRLQDRLQRLSLVLSAKQVDATEFASVLGLDDVGRMEQVGRQDRRVARRPEAGGVGVG